MEQRSQIAELFAARHLHIFTEGDDRLLIRSGARLGYSLLALILVAIGAFGVLVCTMVFVAARSVLDLQPHRWPELVLGGVCGAFFIVCEAAFIYQLLRYATPEWTLLDLNNRTATRRRVGFPRRTIGLDSVDSVDLVMVGDPQTHSCFLALAKDSDQAVWVFHWLGGYRRAETYRDELVPAAKLVAGFLGKPLYSSYGRMRKMAWCRGEQRERIV